MKRTKKAVSRTRRVPAGKLELHVAPEVGSVVLFEGRPLVFLYQERYVAQSGNAFEALYWRTLCVTCGTEFIARTLLGFAGMVTKRCEAHRDGKRIPHPSGPSPIYMIEPDGRTIREIPRPQAGEPDNECA